jgi:uncharacterized protein YycO
MDYPLFELGDLVLSHKPSVFAYPIQWFTKCEWTHVDVYTGGGWICGAVYPKVRIAELKDVPIFSIWRINSLSADQRADIAKFCLNKLNQPYDWKLFFLLAYRIITDSLQTCGSDPDTKAYVCSELIAEACSTVGISFGKFIDNVLPKTIVTSPLVTKIYEQLG